MLVPDGPSFPDRLVGCVCAYAAHTDRQTASHTWKDIYCVYIIHTCKDYIQVSPRSCVGNTFPFSEFRSRSRSRAMQARGSQQQRMPVCPCGSSDEGRCDPCAHVHGSAGQVPCISAVAHPHPHKDAQERSDIPPPIQQGGGAWVSSQCTKHTRLLPLCPSAPPYYSMYYPPTSERNFVVCHSCIFTMGASWRRNVSHSRACSCVTTHARAMPISQFAVSSALPRVRHPPGCPGRAQASKADSQSRRCPASKLLISSSQLDPSVRQPARRGAGHVPTCLGRVRATDSISGPFLSEHRVLDSVTINCALIAGQYTHAAAIPPVPVCYITERLIHPVQSVGHLLRMPARMGTADWLHLHVSF